MIEPEQGDFFAVGNTISSTDNFTRVLTPSMVWPACRFVMFSRHWIAHVASRPKSWPSGDPFRWSSARITWIMLSASELSAATKSTNRRYPNRIAHSAARIAIDVFPLPRGMAEANSPPFRMTRSVSAIAARWSSLHASGNVVGKYTSRK